MKIYAILFLVVTSFINLQALAEVKSGDLVLIKGYNRGVSVYRPAYVMLSENNISVVQELNYPSRYGSTSYTYNTGGQVVKTYGVQLLQNSEIVETADSVVRNGAVLKAGDLFKVKLSPRSHTYRDANILAVFQNGKVLVMSSEDYLEFKKDGDRVFVRGPVSLFVR